MKDASMNKISSGTSIAAVGQILSDNQATEFRVRLKNGQWMASATKNDVARAVTNKHLHLAVDELVAWLENREVTLGEHVMRSVCQD